MWQGGDEELSKLFRSFDTSGNNLLTLVEVQRGLIAVVGSSAIVDGFAPAIIRAFHAAREHLMQGAEPRASLHVDRYV